MTARRWFFAKRLAVAGLVLAAGLIPASAARAGLLDCLCYCEKPTYSPAHYWAPAAVQVYDRACGPKVGLYAPNRHPDIPPDYCILKFRCPPALPVETIIDAPLAPPTSQARYILGPR